MSGLLCAGLWALAKMGSTDSEFQTRTRHWLPVSTSECLAGPGSTGHTIFSLCLQVPASASGECSPLNCLMLLRLHRLWIGGADGTVMLAADHQFPSDPRQFVGQRHRRELGWLACD